MLGFVERHFREVGEEGWGEVGVRGPVARDDVPRKVDPASAMRKGACRWRVCGDLRPLLDVRERVEHDGTVLPPVDLAHIDGVPSV